MNTKDDLEIAAQQAKWSACHQLMQVANTNGGMDLSALSKAFFHAGEAWAYYNSSNVVDSIDAKLNKKEKKSV